MIMQFLHRSTASGHHTILHKKLLSVPLIALITICVSVSFLFKLSEAYIITLDAHSEECFFERARGGTKLVFAFQVTEGGFLDIDVSIFDPAGNLINQASKKTSDTYAIEAGMDGPYKYCFSNKMSTVTPKVVMFMIQTAKMTQHRINQDANERVRSMIKDLEDAMTSVKHELAYLSVRDRIHRRINDDTNYRVVIWTWIEFLILLSVSLGQVMYIKRFFEVRRAI